jgi:hypothetical protein
MIITTNYAINTAQVNSDKLLPRWLEYGGTAIAVRVETGHVTPVRAPPDKPPNERLLPSYRPLLLSTTLSRFRHLLSLAARRILRHYRPAWYSTADATRARLADSLVRSSQTHRARRSRNAVEPCAGTFLCGKRHLVLGWEKRSYACYISFNPSLFTLSYISYFT